MSCRSEQSEAKSVQFDEDKIEKMMETVFERCMEKFVSKLSNVMDEKLSNLVAKIDQYNNLFNNAEMEVTKLKNIVEIAEKSIQSLSDRLDKLDMDIGINVKSNVPDPDGPYYYENLCWLQYEEVETLNTMFKLYVKKVYGKDEDGEGKHTLIRLNILLGEFEVYDDVFQEVLRTNETSGKSLIGIIDKCFDTLYDKTHGLEHSPKSLLLLANFFNRLGASNKLFRQEGIRVACELIWGASVIAVDNFIGKHKINLNALPENRRKEILLLRLSYKAFSRLSSLESCHENFYSNHWDFEMVDDNSKRASDFVKYLDEFDLTDEMKTHLETKHDDDSYLKKV